MNSVQYCNSKTQGTQFVYCQQLNNMQTINFIVTKGLKTVELKDWSILGTVDVGLQYALKKIFNCVNNLSFAWRN